MMGAFAGISMSCPPAILRKWVPADERGSLVGGALSGGTFGVIVAMPLSGIIVERLGWESVFYVFGALSLLWGLLWFLFARESPDQMSWINSDELDYIKSKVATVDQKSKKIPFKNICLIGFVNIFQNATFRCSMNKLVMFLSYKMWCV